VFYHTVSAKVTKAPPRRILVPVDFSSHSAASRDYAVAIARALGAEIHLLHAWNPLAWMLPNDELMLPGGQLPVVCDAWQGILDCWREVVQETGVSCTAHLEAGPASSTIAPNS